MIHGWSLHLDYWNRLTEVLSEIPEKFQWKQVPLDVMHRMSVPANKSGVYMLCLRPPQCDRYFGMCNAPLFNPLYIGRTKNLQRRFGNYATYNNASHNNGDKHSPTMTSFLRDYSSHSIIFAYAIFNLEMSKIRIIEDALIKSFGPSVNERYEITDTTVAAKAESGHLI